MSAALKFASMASGLTLLSASAYHTYKNPQQDFSKNALAMDHTLETPEKPAVKPKLPSNFIQLNIGGYEFKNAA